jgi:hypothetical protein
MEFRIRKFPPSFFLSWVPVRFFIRLRNMYARAARRNLACQSQYYSYYHRPDNRYFMVLPPFVQPQPFIQTKKLFSVMQRYVPWLQLHWKYSLTCTTVIVHGQTKKNPLSVQQRDKKTSDYVVSLKDPDAFSPVVLTQTLTSHSLDHSLDTLDHSFFICSSVGSNPRILIRRFESFG